MRPIWLLVLAILACRGYGQDNPCTCDGLVAYKRKLPVSLLDKPGGRVIRQLKQNFAGEDFLVWQADQQQGGYFHATVSYAISGKSYTGWLQPSNRLGTYIRNYGSAVPLHTAPRTSAPIRATITPQEPMYFLPIIRCGRGWVYVRAVLKGKVYEGWLAPKDQCANPYTTCS